MVEDFPFEEFPIEFSSDRVKVIRTFNEKVETEELLWHWDDEDRIITPAHQTDWMFQFDNKLPQQIHGEIKIPSGVWHRLIKGTGGLTLTVEKLGYIKHEAH